MKFFFVLAVLYLSVTNLVFGAQAIAQWAYLTEQPLSIPLPWLVAGKLVWGGLFGLTAWGLWRLRAWGRRALLVGITLYQVHIWANHLFFDVSVLARQAWPFEIGLSVVTLAVVWGGMFLPKLRRLYGGKA